MACEARRLRHRLPGGGSAARAGPSRGTAGGLGQRAGRHLRPRGQSGCDAGCVRPGDERHRPEGARLHGRLGRPGPFDQDALEGPRPLRLRRVLRPQHALRRPRARHGRDSKRHGAPRRDHPLYGNLPDLLRLHASVHTAGRPDGAARRVHLHARLHRTRRGRPDAPTDRAAHGAAGGAEPGSATSRRRHRDCRGMEGSARSTPRPDRALPEPPEPTSAGPGQARPQPAVSARVRTFSGRLPPSPTSC